MNSTQPQLPLTAKFAEISKFGDTSVFNVIENELPEINAMQILIKVHAASINPIDWKQRKGNHKFILGASFPIVLGYDVAGTIVKIGSSVTKFHIGDEVMGVLDNKYGGAYGEYAKGTEKCFTKRSENVSVEQAASAPMAALTSLQALRDKGKLKQGQTLLVNGASGGVGHIAMQIGKIMGVKVIAVSSTESKKFVMQFAPDQFIDYKTEKINFLNEKVNVFFDVAGVYDFVKVKHLLKPNGIYVNTLPRPKIVLHKMFQLFTKGKKVKTLLMKHDPNDLEIVAEWLQKKKLKIKIDKQFPLIKIAEAHNYAQLGHSKGKNLIIINKTKPHSFEE